MSAIPPLFQPTVPFADPCVAPVEWRPPVDRIVSGDPAQRAWNLYTSLDGHFSAGIWECQPGKWRVIFTESEFCHLLEGRIEVTGDDGSVCVYEAGEAFVSPAGFTGYWEVLAPARKYYAIHE